MHPVFTIEDLRDAQVDARKNDLKTMEPTLAYYQRKGRIRRVRRGLYVSVPAGATPENVQVDPFLLAGMITDDATLAYHTALAFFGKSYSLHQKLYYCTHQATREATFSSIEFVGVRFPKALIAQHQEYYGVETAERSGLAIRVTSLERTLVDVLDRPRYGGSWEETWRSLEMIEYVDLDMVLEYALILQNATTIAKVGWFLEQHRGTLMVSEEYLERLAEHRPVKPHYMDQRRHEPGRMVNRWNLVAPQSLYDRTWEEPE